MTALLRFLLLAVLTLYFSYVCHCKIVLPHKLRYLENMLNAEVVAKAAKIRQQMEANPNIQERERSWPVLLGQYQAEDQNKINSINSIPTSNFGSLYNRRLPKF
ncbi:hypothetical protein PYW08_000437 [Mythimna loreyi]|uniref:Uncharacterized protein n=1 Tax=Mythimna loreyi TaxID=667449 RepID=A0ACC2RCH3_9NEOP|nr:hypothetical protein PYW08_000437 [Mythimna loreyi]